MNGWTNWLNITHKIGLNEWKNSKNWRLNEWEGWWRWHWPTSFLPLFPQWWRGTTSMGLASLARLNSPSSWISFQYPWFPCFHNDSRNSIIQIQPNSAYSALQARAGTPGPCEVLPFWASTLGWHPMSIHSWAYIPWTYIPWTYIHWDCTSGPIFPRLLWVMSLQWQPTNWILINIIFLLCNIHMLYTDNMTYTYAYNIMAFHMTQISHIWTFI